MKMIHFVFVTAFVFSFSIGRAEFASRKVRYASSYDVLNLLNKNFPGHGQGRTIAISVKCDSVTSVNRDVLGASNAVSGQPLMEKPNPGFLRWLSQCLTEYTKFEFAPDKAYRPDFAKSYLPKSLQSEDLANLMKRKWVSLAPDVRSSIVDRVAYRMIGPPAVFQTYSPNKTWIDFTSSIEASMAPLLPADASVATAMASAAQTVFLRDEFLRY